jgi:geranylgeranyl diphosphate synthase, type II
LIQASILLGAIAARASATERAALATFGAEIGLAFQIQDDILDVEGDVRVIGKPPGSDQARGMPTYPATAGLAAARARVQELHAAANDQLATHAWQDSPLSGLSDWLLTRNR